MDYKEQYLDYSGYMAAQWFVYLLFFDIVDTPQRRIAFRSAPHADNCACIVASLDSCMDKLGCSDRTVHDACDEQHSCTGRAVCLDLEVPRRQFHLYP